MDMTALDKAVEAAGSQLALANLLGIKAPSVSGWYDRSRVPAERCIAIEAATGVSRHELRPDVFGEAASAAFTDSTRSAKVADIRKNVDLRMSKRALRAKFGFKSDAHLAVVLGVSAEVIDAWPEGENVPAGLVGAVQKLLGHEDQPTQQAGPQDPDEQRIVTLEVA